VVTFTSSSTVRNFVALLGSRAKSLSLRNSAAPIRTASIGPVTKGAFFSKTDLRSGFSHVKVAKRFRKYLGFTLFGIGLALNCLQTTSSDFQAMVVPQIVRGSAIMFCLLPPTRLALGHLESAAVPNASGLFNLMRNLGGAVGLALIDTVIYGRAPELANEIAARLKAGDVATAKAVGLPIDDFLAFHDLPLDADTRALIEPLVRKLALTYAINEAWLVIAAITFSAMLWLIFASRHRLTKLTARDEDSRPLAIRGE